MQHGRAAGLPVGEREREIVRKGRLTYGARGSGRTRVKYIRRILIVCPVPQFCSFRTSPRTRAYTVTHTYTYKTSVKTANETLFKINR